MSYGIARRPIAERVSKFKPTPDPVDGFSPMAEGPGFDQNFRWALDALPLNVMYCDRQLILRYLNKASRKTLASLQQYLPVPVDEIVGKSIHIFHRNQSRRKSRSADDIEHLNGNLQMVATATHQIESSIAEIARNAVEVAKAAEKSRAASSESKASIESLKGSSSGSCQGGGADCLHCHPDQRAGAECQH
jgi:hypothetical protein